MLQLLAIRINWDASHIESGSLPIFTVTLVKDVKTASHLGNIAANSHMSSSSSSRPGLSSSRGPTVYLILTCRIFGIYEAAAMIQFGVRGVGICISRLTVDRFLMTLTLVVKLEVCSVLA